MTTNREVAQAWINGQAAWSGNMHTDGKTIWSYALPIGHIGCIAQGPIYVRKAQAGLGPGSMFYSMTTSHHIAHVLYAARGARADFGYTNWLSDDTLDDAQFEDVIRRDGARV